MPDAAPRLKVSEAFDESCIIFGLNTDIGDN